MSLSDPPAGDAELVRRWTGHSPRARPSDSQGAIGAAGRGVGVGLRLRGYATVERRSSSRRRWQRFVARRRSGPDRRQCLRRTRYRIQLVSRPRRRGGCRLRSYGGLQWPDGFRDPSGVSVGCGLLWFSGHLSDERGQGHQIECGIFQTAYAHGSGRESLPPDVEVEVRAGERVECSLYVPADGATT